MFNDKLIKKAQANNPYHHDVLLGELNKQRQDLRNKKEALELRTAIAHSNVKLQSLPQWRECVRLV